MGGIYRAECKCGYRSGELFLQFGIVYADRFFVPALCRECREIVVVNYIENPGTCPTCSKKIVLFDELSAGEDDHPVKQGEALLSYYNDKDLRDFIMWDTYYLCPKCGECRLVFEWVGYWD